MFKTKNIQKNFKNLNVQIKVKTFNYNIKFNIDFYFLFQCMVIKKGGGGSNKEAKPQIGLACNTKLIKNIGKEHFKKHLVNCSTFR